MKIYPAIDMMDGQAVRLSEGKRESRKTYGSPLEYARRFSPYVDKIHLVDLDGAFKGSLRNLEVVEDIVEKTDLSVQLGGGIRDIETVERAYSIGVDNVILGTKAFDTEFLETVTGRFDGVTASLDAKDGKVSVKGWEEKSHMKIEEAFDLIRNYVDRFIYTSVERDGTLTGIEEIDKFWTDQEFIYAGGVASIRDIEKLERIGFDGAIIGKALYEEELDLKDLSGMVGDPNVS